MTQIRMIILAAAAIALCAAAAAVATWKAEAAHAVAVRDLRDQIDQLARDKHALELAIAEQNKGVAVAEAQTRAAQAAQAAAEQHAADLAAFSRSRMDKLAAAFETATSCDAVLQRYWELRK